MRDFLQRLKEFFDTKFFVTLFCYVMLVLTFLEFAVFFSKQEQIRVLDNSILEFFYSIRLPALNSFMEFMTFFGNMEVVVLFSLCVVLYFWVRKREKFLFAFFSSSLVAASLIYSIKHLFERQRPPVENALVYADGFSFPSGHALMSVAFYGILTYFVIATSRSKIERITAMVFGIILIFLISISRIYLGVHWPSDVFSGLILGGAWLSIVIFLTRHPNRKLEMPD
jgi:undecaprenyl-diphosphatase